MIHAVHVQLFCFLLAEMVVFPFALFVVTLCENRLANQADALAMSEGRNKINPFYGCHPHNLGCRTAHSRLERFYR